MASEITSSEVTIVDVRMPFMSMVVFLVKLAIAAIPATIILWLLGVLLMMLLSFVGGGMGMMN